MIFRHYSIILNDFVQSKKFLFMFYRENISKKENKNEK